VCEYCAAGAVSLAQETHFPRHSLTMRFPILALAILVSATVLVVATAASPATNLSTAGTGKRPNIVINLRLWN